MEHKRIPLRIKALNEREFEGYGSTFGNEDLGGDVVLPGAFKSSLEHYKSEDSLPLMFWAHDPAQVPGRWIEMEEDKRGLRVKGELADTQLGNEMRTLLNMKAVRGLSIGFMIPHGGAEWEEDGTRMIKEAELFEVSLVSLPMNPRANVVHAKARLSASGEYVPTEEEMAELKRKMEHWLRSQGLTKAIACAYASAAFAADEESVEMPEAPVAAVKDAGGATPEADGRDAKDPPVSDEFRAVQRVLAERLRAVNDSMLTDLARRKLDEGRK